MKRFFLFCKKYSIYKLDVYLYIHTKLDDRYTKCYKMVKNKVIKFFL